MRILLSNDDGYFSAGLKVLADAIQPIADITIVAPNSNQSGSSHSLTLDSPLCVKEDSNMYIVDGTPTDCVHLAITGLLDNEPDMVIAGINHGSNLGDDVLYSGTVAAAIEGRFLGFPAIAVSLVGDNPENFHTAAKIVCKLLDRLKANPLPPDTILNVNVPDIEFEKIKGFQATRLGSRQRSEQAILENDSDGNPMYWVGPAGAGLDAGAGTDFYAVKSNYVSVTPIKIDLTLHDALPSIENWLSAL
ncbi:MAG: 5'/3'-nucleotidase SurE [Pseudomonadota bacterium]|nr:5'/3'-nucleotidase SurE [Pseudomonadota bacterium]